MENISLTSYKKIETFNQALFYKGDIALEKLIAQKHILQSEKLFNDFVEANNIGTPFSIVFVSDDDIIIVSDIVRSYPVFYSIVGNQVFITENIKTIPEKCISNEAVSVFLQAGFSLGPNTIYRNINGIQAAEILSIKRRNKNIDSQRYFAFKPNHKAADKSVEKFVEEFDALMLTIIKRLIESIPTDKNLIIPLSGGCDSRIIANYLKKLNVKNVICFSYGRKNNTQSNISQRVAEACGYEWYFVEYTEEKWAKLHDIGLINNYIEYSFQGVSIPHLQDFLAVYELRQRKIIKKGDVFIPGHTLDMLSGGHFNDADMACNDELSSLKRTGSRHSIIPTNLIQFLYIEKLSSIYKEVETEPHLFQEYINWQERQAKFIVNSCKAYSFFEFEFLLPFWDMKLVKHFLKLNETNRLERNLFISAQRKGILLPELSAIEFEYEVKTKPVKKSIKERVLNRVPPFIRAFGSRYLGRKTYKAEALNQIYALQGNTIKSILGSHKIYPKELQKYIKSILIRKPYQVNYHNLTSLLTIKKALDNN